MSLRIACDLDGTVADMDAALQREAKRMFGPDVDLHAQLARTESAEDVETEIASTDGGEVRPKPDATPATVTSIEAVTRPLRPRELRRLWQHVLSIENFWSSLGEIEPGAVAKLYARAATNRWEVLFLTQRPSSAGDRVQIQSQRWLQAHGFEMPSLFVMRGGSRGRVADALALDAVIDDRPENCLDVVTDSKATPILVWRTRPEEVPPGIPRTGITVVYSMEEALGHLEGLTEERTRRGSFMSRLRSAIVGNRGAT
jgi:hypothetical protein